MGSVGTKKGLVDQSTVGFGVSKPALGGMVAWCKAIVTLSSPAMPAAAFKWPIWLLMEPTATLSPASMSVHKVPRVDNSVASPTLVDVP